jgi:hypothetical protein
VQDLILQLSVLLERLSTVEVCVKANKPVLQSMVSAVAAGCSCRLQYLPKFIFEILGSVGMRLFGG